VWEAVVHRTRVPPATVIARFLPGAGLVISGDGRSAWVHRVDGRLVRIAIDSLRARVPGRHA
jgi:hypothetical protein